MCVHTVQSVSFFITISNLCFTAISLIATDSMFISIIMYCGIKKDTFKILCDCPLYALWHRLHVYLYNVYCGIKKDTFKI